MRGSKPSRSHESKPPEYLPGTGRGIIRRMVGGHQQPNAPLPPSRRREGPGVGTLKPTSRERYIIDPSRMAAKNGELALRHQLCLNEGFRWASLQFAKEV